MKRIIITESQLKKVKKTLLNEYRITTPRARQREYEEWLAKKEKKEKERLERKKSGKSFWDFLKGKTKSTEDEANINEIGHSSFSETKPIDNTEQGKTLRPAIAKLKGVNHIVIIDKEDKIIGYGPPISNMDRGRICSIAQSLIDEWEDEVNMNEIDQPDFGKIQPISFCNIK